MEKVQSVNVLQRLPVQVLEGIDAWAAGSGMGRTAAITHMCRAFLEAVEVGTLRRENRELREKLAATAWKSNEGKWGN